MSIIKDLEKNSYRHSVVALTAVGRIFETITDEGSCVVKFVTDNGEDKVMCPHGDLCDNPDCKLHHLHCDVDRISENYVLCPYNTDCKDLKCEYRHTKYCRDSMNELFLCSTLFQDDYYDYVNMLKEKFKK